jgi:hypothetical protein
MMSILTTERTARTEEEMEEVVHQWEAEAPQGTIEDTPDQGLLVRNVENRDLDQTEAGETVMMVIMEEAEAGAAIMIESTVEEAGQEMAVDVVEEMEAEKEAKGTEITRVENTCEVEILGMIDTEEIADLDGMIITVVEISIKVMRTIEDIITGRLLLLVITMEAVNS